jgi:hypothetical protein
MSFASVAHPPNALVEKHAHEKAMPKRRAARPYVSSLGHRSFPAQELNPLKV